LKRNEDKLHQTSKMPIDEQRPHEEHREDLIVWIGEKATMRQEENAFKGPSMNKQATNPILKLLFQRFKQQNPL
jgi:hypothetical protein